VGVARTLDQPTRGRLRDLVTSAEADPEWMAEQRRRHGPIHGDDHGRVLLDVLLSWAADPDALPFEPPDLATISRPTLVLQGDRDTIYPVELANDLYRSISNAELAIVPGAGHSPVRDSPDLVVRILMDFISRKAR
jgi:pimeloyl-ACP methyl ester carboxylesterase